MSYFLSRNTYLLKDISEKILEKYFKKQGLISSTFIFKWKEIIGNDLAICCFPLKFSFPLKNSYKQGTLLLYVDHGAGVKIDHQKDHIIERVNQYFGYKIIAKLSLKQGFFSPKQENFYVKLKKNTKIPEKEVNYITQKITDEGIRHALYKLGKAIQ